MWIDSDVELDAFHYTDEQLESCQDDLEFLEVMSTLDVLSDGFAKCVECRQARPVNPTYRGKPV